MIRKKLFWHVYPYFFFIIIGSLFAVAYFAVHRINDIYLDEISSTLETRAKLFANKIQTVQITAPETDIDSLTKKFGQISKTRITIIDSDGVVLGDSEKDPSQMENHGKRPEVVEAYSGKTGQQIRYSSTVNTNMMYVAITTQLSDQRQYVIRTALSMNKIQTVIRSFNNDMIYSGIIIAVLATLLSIFLFQRITTPLGKLKERAQSISEGDLSTKITGFEAEEIAALGDAMNNMSSQLDNRIATIIQQRNERDAILSSLEEGVLALDANENIVSINKKALELLDISNDDVIGKSIQEIVRNDKLHDLIDKSLKQSTDVEGEMHIQVGDEKYLSVYGTLLLNSDNNQIGTVIVLNDISKIKKLDIIRRDFVANVSHELKTPITAIKGSAETLLEGALDNRESAVQFTTIINRHAKRLIAIVQDLLTLAKFENEQVIQSIKFNNETLYPALESAVFACEQKYSSKNIQVSIYCPDDLVVSMHRHYLEHAIINLLDNAIKYSDDNATVTIAVEKQDNKIIISVTDQGSGIDSQHLPRLFERFYRVDMARSRELGGTGLGLAIVKHIARVHKGTVDVKSVPGEGSTFSIIIPS